MSLSPKFNYRSSPNSFAGWIGFFPRRELIATPRPPELSSPFWLRWLKWRRRRTRQLSHRAMVQNLTSGHFLLKRALQLPSFASLSLLFWCELQYQSTPIQAPELRLSMEITRLSGIGWRSLLISLLKNGTEIALSMIWNTGV